LPAGLGARDTLRLEAAMPLYGHELSETINPVQAGLEFAMNLQDREFIGCQAIAKFKQDANQPVRVGLVLSGRRAAREHSPVIVESQVVGEVTSGTFSPTLQQPIAMAYVNRKLATTGLEVEVDIRGKKQAATVVKLPFYERKA
jgi:aminomethyltransferase